MTLDTATTLAPVPAVPAGGDARAGFVYALMAYVLWGFLPIYLKALDGISPMEVIAHRILWSLPVAGLVLWVTGRTADLRAALRSPPMLGMALLTALLISVNWTIYVWAVGSGRALDAALGYYINPLFSIALGAVLLSERLERAQLAAIALAAAAVALLTIATGHLPAVALGLTLSWGAYAFCKKRLPVGANQGFFLEILVLSPLAFGYVVWLGVTGTGHFMVGTGWDTTLLIGAGLVTAIPLMLYANGAKLLRLSTIAVMQYIAPTMVFLIAVFLFDEPFGRVKLIAFAMIWTALAIYSLSMLHSARGARRARGLRGG